MIFDFSVLDDYKKKNNISEYELVKRLGLSRQVLNMYRHGISTPTMTTVVKMASLLKVDDINIFFKKNKIKKKNNEK